MRLCTGGDHQAFEHGDARTQHLLLFEMLTGHLQQQGRFIMFEGTFSQPCEQLLVLFVLHAAKAQMIQHRLEVGTLGHPTRAIVLEHCGVDVELLCQKGDGVQGSRLEVRWTKTEVAHGAKLERQAGAPRLSGVGRSGTSE